MTARDWVWRELLPVADTTQDHLARADAADGPFLGGNQPFWSSSRAGKGTPHLWQYSMIADMWWRD